ncbi:MAG: DUF2784 domain-containing protein [Verrucomicrobiota bacterium]
MIYRLLADGVLLFHFAFILFGLFGGLLILRRRIFLWIHLPVVAWIVAIEFVGWICPLTPLENRLRAAGGEAGYQGGFVEHYILPIIYPAGLTRNIQIVLGLIALGINGLIYGLVWRRLRRT